MHSTITLRKLRSARRRENGQALLEFAIVVVVFPLILVGVFDLGRAFQTKIVVTNAAREAARFLSQNPADKEVAFDGTISAGLREAEDSSVTLVGSDIAVTQCVDDTAPTGCDSGSAVEVTVTKEFSFFLSPTLFDPLMLSSSTRMYVP